jgi:hypothetical protein
MTTVQRSIFVNVIEPQTLSLNAPANMPLTINLTYYNQAGTVLSSDVLGQLQLTGRTCNSAADVYPVPATDIINGKARVAIGSGDLTDMNGYSLRLIGTYRGDTTLLALGTLRLTDAAGIDTTPIDVIDSIPINLTYGYIANIDIHLWQDATKETPFDLTSATITAAVYATSAALTQLVPFSISTIGPGEVMLQLTDVQIATLPVNSWWSLRAANAAGVTTLCQGTVTVIGKPGP